MESVLNLKQCSKTSVSTCLICLKPPPKGKKLSNGGEKAVRSLQSAASLRNLKYNPQYKGAIQRIQELNLVAITYHPSCYATFTSNEMIMRLDDIDVSLQNVEKRDQAIENATEWDRCILCQEPQGRNSEHLRQVSSQNKQQQLRDLAEWDVNLNIRIGGTSTDLILAGAKYHSNCYNKRNREKNKSVNEKSQSKQSQQALKELSAELHIAAENGKVFKLRDVYDRYVELAISFNETVPPSFSSRISTFKDKLGGLVGGIYQFYQPLNVNVEDRQMLLIPTKYQFSLVSEAVIDGFDPTERLCETTAPDNPIIDIVHTGLKIHSDMNAMSGHKGLDVSEDAAKKIVPESLFMLLSLLIRGQSSLDEMLESDCDNDENSDHDENCEDDIGNSGKYFEKKILSIAQDIIYVASKGKKLTPKHIGLGLALHQKTRSRKLINLFNSAGHCVTYSKVLQIDNTLADLTLSTIDHTTGSVVPPHFKSATTIKQENPQLRHEPILQITADNIDIIADTLDGKNSFHGTQVVAFQRNVSSSSSASILDEIGIKKKVPFRIPAILSQLPPEPTLPPFSPTFSRVISTDWYKRHVDVTESVQHAKAMDMSFLICRQNESESNYTGWTEFNERISQNNHQVTTQGYLPLILNPAHEHCTLLLFLQRAVSLADSLNYKHIVATIDQALHLKLCALLEANPIYKERVIVKMGGLHLAMNYLRAIGQHMADTGLSEIWKESDLLADGSILKVLDGKAYAKAMRAHKLTFQAMWRILIPRLLSFVQQKSPTVYSTIAEAGKNVDSIVDIVKSEKFASIMAAFIEHESMENSNFKFWWTYVDSISTLLLFTRSLRAGQWDIYLHGVKSMLPLMERYNHRNYVCSVTIFLAQMNQLPNDVKAAFVAGDFVVKITEGTFNQVDADHAQEWMVGISKDSGGIVGVTQKDNTLQRWALSFGWRTEITQKTFAMYGLASKTMITNEATKARRARDCRDEESIYRSLTYFNVLAPIQYSGMIQNIVTKDVVSQKIQDFLLNVVENGERQVLVFVKERLIGDENGVRISFDEPVKQNIVSSMTTLYEPSSVKPTQPLQKILKAHGNTLQRLVMAFEAGREMNLEKMLEHELQEYPLSLVETNGQLRSGNPLGIHVLTKSEDWCVSVSTSKTDAQVIVSGDTLVGAVPKNLKTFGELAEYFKTNLDLLTINFSRIDVIFNRHVKASMLDTVTSKKTRTPAPIRRIIENEKVAVPKQWQTFMALDENREDLYRFLASEMSKIEFDATDVIFSETTDIFSSITDTCTDELKCWHDDEVMRIALQAVKTEKKVVVIYASDSNGKAYSNLIVLLVHHFKKMKCEELWLRTGTAKKRLFVPIHKICSTLSLIVKQNILAFDAITGSPLTSFIAGISKNSAWNIYLEQASLLSGLCKSNLTNNAIRSAENFVVKLYKLGHKASTTNSARYILFGSAKSPELLPPTTDAIVQHIKRCHVQLLIWQNIYNPHVNLGSLLRSGWNLNSEGKIVPVLTTLNPITNSSIEMATCGCKGQCVNLRCHCVKGKMPCTALCSCIGVCKNIKNDSSSV